MHAGFHNLRQITIRIFKDILIDDYNPNLYSWMSRGGTAIKYINNVNSVDSWVGSYIAEYMEDSVMFDFLMRVVMETNK